MTAKSQIQHDLLRASAESVPGVLRVASVGGGLTMSLLILLGITQARKTSVPPPAPPIEDLRAMVMDTPPPPPPPEAAAQIPEPPAAMQLQPVSEPEGINISAIVRPSVPPVPTVAPLSIDLDVSAFKPGADMREVSPRHVYQSREVDQRPVILYRKIPRVTSRMLESVKEPRVTLIFVVNVDGTVGKIHVLRQPSKEFGDVMVDAVSEWRFRPAMKDGRKVRCMIQLPIYVKPATESRFHL